MSTSRLPLPDDIMERTKDADRQIAFQRELASATGYRTAPGDGDTDWIRYLKATGNYDSYDGLCNCYRCREIIAGFDKWRAAQCGMPNADGPDTKQKWDPLHGYNFGVGWRIEIPLKVNRP